jgi:hypothetical protein
MSVTFTIATGDLDHVVAICTASPSDHGVTFDEASTESVAVVAAALRAVRSAPSTHILVDIDAPAVGDFVRLLTAVDDTPWSWTPAERNTARYIKAQLAIHAE